MRKLTKVEVRRVETNSQSSVVLAAGRCLRLGKKLPSFLLLGRPCSFD